MGKGEIACYEQFLLFQQCFQKACFPGASKGVIVWEWVKTFDCSVKTCLCFIVSAQGNRYCQNCFYGADFCDPVSFRCIYGCRQGYKGSLCLEQCITKGCKHCEYQRNGIEQCTRYSLCLYPLKQTCIKIVKPFQKPF